VVGSMCDIAAWHCQVPFALSAQSVWDKGIVLCYRQRRCWASAYYSSAVTCSLHTSAARPAASLGSPGPDQGLINGHDHWYSCDCLVTLDMCAAGMTCTAGLPRQLLRKEKTLRRPLRESQTLPAGPWRCLVLCWRIWTDEWESESCAISID
jgi:hypothetical protein